MGDNVCFHCQAPDPTFLCLCQEVTICRNCISQHLLSDPSPLHKPLPLDRNELIQTVRQEITQRTSPLSTASQDHLKTLTSLIKRELSRIQAFRTASEVKLQQTKSMWESQIAKAVAEGKEIVRKLTEKAIMELYQILAEISTNGEAMERVWGQGRSEDEEIVDLGMDIRSVDLVGAVKGAIGVVVSIRTEMTPAPALYKFFGGVNQVGVFEAKSEEYGRALQANGKFFHNSCSCLSPNGLIYVTGGSLTGRSRAEVFAFNPKTVTVVPLLPMLMARRSHASICMGTKCYVFGGLIEDDDRSSLCELYEVETGCWKSIERMNERRAYLGCCEYRSQLYIGGGAPSPSLEVYTPIQDSFTLLSLPEGSLEDNCCMLPLADTILLFHGNYQGVLSRLWPETGKITKEREICYGNSWSSCAPVMVNGTVYMLRSESVFKYALESGESAYVLRMGKTVQRRLQFD